MSIITPRLYFFTGYSIICIISIIINIVNIKWNQLHLYIGIIYLLLQGICTLSVSEILLKTILVFTHKPNKIKSVQNIGNTSFIINYNIKAEDKQNINECFTNMYKAFIGNITKKSTAVIISVTEIDEIKKYEDLLLKVYRKKLLNYLYISGQRYINNGNNCNNNDHCWWSTVTVNNKNLLSICKQRCEDFILLRRKSNVLKKCGQYQDLIAYSLGYSNSYTYIDENLYGNKARVRDAFFVYNNDSNKIFDKNFDYTFVLDSDTVVPKNNIINLIKIAMANPKYIIFQPKIEFYNIQTN